MGTPQIELSSGLTLVDNLPSLVQQAAEMLEKREPTLLERAASVFMRMIEIGLAAIALILTSPIMLIIAVIIRLDSPGAALFRQGRIGLSGHIFKFYKFRTLYADARERFPELYSYSYTPQQIQELQFKWDGDPRVTRMGKWLRKTTLDELPNFWNLLRGDVALVGPRPEIPEMLAYYTPEQMLKFSVKPGITGLAQTCGRGRLKFQQTTWYDLEYVRSRSFGLDWKIILRTIKLVIKLDGAF